MIQNLAHRLGGVYISQRVRTSASIKMELTPPGVFRKALGDLSPNVGSPMRVGPTGSRNRLMGKILGGASGRENPMSPKREGKILIEPRPEELSANKELFKSPTKMSRMAETET